MHFNCCALSYPSVINTELTKKKMIVALNLNVAERTNDRPMIFQVSLYPSSASSLVGENFFEGFYI